MKRAVRVTFDETMLTSIDEVARFLGTSRSAFIREALHQAVQQETIRRLERQHAVGYARQLVRPGEFDIWQKGKAGWEK